MSKSPRERDALWKWVIIGDSGTGKTSILSRLCNDEFCNTFISTIGIDFKIKKMEVGGKNITVQIWDTAGQERFGTITKSCYRGSNGIMLCYDITNRSSFENVHKWVKDIQIHAGDSVARVLLGNKYDMEGSQRAVSPEEGRAVAEQNGGIPFLEVSAKTGKNIEQAFETLAQVILGLGGETTANSSPAGSGNKKTINNNSNNSKETTSSSGNTMSSSSKLGSNSPLVLVSSSRNNNKSTTKSNSSSNTTFASSSNSSSNTNTNGATNTTFSSSSSSSPSSSVSVQNQSSFLNEDSDVIRLGNFHSNSRSTSINPDSDAAANEENLFETPVRKSRCC